MGIKELGGDKVLRRKDKWWEGWGGGVEIELG